MLFVLVLVLLFSHFFLFQDKKTEMDRELWRERALREQRARERQRGHESE